MTAITIADLANAKADVDHLAAIATSTELTATDRMGNVKRTMKGALNEYPNALVNAAAALDSSKASLLSATASEASRQVSVTQAGISTAQAGLAVTAKTAAEAARDAAAIAGKVYADTTAGLAATTSGQYFTVPSALVGESLILYRNNGGSALESKRYPAAGFKRYMGIATPAMTPQVAADNYYLAVTPGTYTNFSGLVVKNEIAQLRYNGSAWVKEVEQNIATPNSIVGEVVKGAFYPGEGGLMIAPGTVVKGYSATKQVFINIPAGLNPMVVDPVALDSTTGKLYCSLTGTLAITDKSNSELPAGEWVLLATCYDYGSGVNGLAFKPVIPSNHYFYGSKNNLLCIPSDKRTVNIKDLGAVGDGVTSDQQALSLFTVLIARFAATSGGQAPYFTATKQPYVLFFPAGTFVFTASSGMNFDSAQLIGAGKSLTTLKAPTATAVLNWNLFDLKDMTLQNIVIGNFNAPTLFRMKNVRHLFDATATNSSSYTVSPGTLDYEVTDCDFDYLGLIYIALRCTGYRSILIERNTFNAAGTGYASHAMRIENPATDKQAVIVRQNRVTGGTTGIFFGSSRVRPTSNCLVELNECLYQTEESIGFDGFGNNANLCPVICNGLITRAANDSTGRLVIVAAMKYHDGTLTNQDSPVSLRTDWTNFYFSLDEGSGRPGTLCKISSANSSTNEFTLEAYTPASSITVGGWVGVQSGFFD